MPANGTVYLCECRNHTAFKAYERYNMITSETSLAYQMLHSNRCSYASDGLIYIDGCLAVAMGTRFGSTGDKLKITFDDGHQINCILADVKADRHTDATNCHTHSNSVMEILINPGIFSEAHPYEWKMGDCNTISMLNGLPIKIEKVGKF